MSVFSPLNANATVGKGSCMPTNVLYECLFCENEFLAKEHRCPFGSDLCSGDKHFDFCPFCQRFVFDGWEPLGVRRETEPFNPPRLVRQ